MMNTSEAAQKEEPASSTCVSQLCESLHNSISYSGQMQVNITCTHTHMHVHAHMDTHGFLP